MSFSSIKTVYFTTLTLLLISSCTSSRYAMNQDRPPKQDIKVNHIPDAKPRPESLSKYGNPESYVVFGKRYHVMKKADGYRQQGVASWYGTKFHGHRTSSGEPYNMYAMTAAHKTLPLPSYVRVTNLDNQRSIVVRVNDRGPFHDDRIIDLSYVAAKKLDITSNGTAKVQVTYIDPRKKPAPRRVSAFQNRPHNSTHLKHKQVKSPSKQFFLQIGAYSEQKNAEQMRQRVADLLENGEINTGYNVESKLYRVRVGPLASAQEANQLASKLSQSGISNSKVIID